MRAPRRLLILLLFPIVLLPVSAQQPTSISSPPVVPSSPMQLIADLGKPPNRDAEAVALVQKAIQAMGGASTVALVRSDLVRGTVAQSAGSSATARTFQWEDDFTGAGYEFRNQFHEADGTVRVFGSGHGKPWVVDGAAVKSLPPQVGYASTPYQVPSIVLSRELSSSAASMTLVGTTTVNGRSALQVHVANNSGVTETMLSPRDWYFDSTSGLPIRLTYRVPEAGSQIPSRQEPR